MITPEKVETALRASGSYTEEVIAKVLEYFNEIIGLQTEWDNFLSEIGAWLGVEGEVDAATLREIERSSLARFSEGLSQADRKGIVLGFDGPGGTGKGTVMDQVGRIIPTKRSINATSREQRVLEQDRIHYFFQDRESILEGCNLSMAARQKLQQTLALSELPNNSIDSSLAMLIEAYCDSNGLMISLELDTASQDSDKLTIAYKPKRGWYNILKSSINSSTEGGTIGVVEESGDSWRNLANSLASTADAPVLGYVMILPPQPIAFVLAARALTRDGVGQSKESLLSTIGHRHIAQTKILLQIAQEFGNPLAVLVNDDTVEYDATTDGNLTPEEISGKKKAVFTRTGRELIRSLQPMVHN